MLVRGPDVIPYRSNFFHGKALRVTKRPLISTEAWNVGALVATTHGDEQLRVASQLLGQLSRLCSAEVDPDLLHDCLNLRMHPLAWLSRARPENSCFSLDFDLHGCRLPSGRFSGAPGGPFVAAP